MLNFNKIEKTKQVCFISFICWLALLFIIYLTHYIPLDTPKIFDIWGCTYFFVDYSNGFLQRGLIGSLLLPFIDLFGTDFSSFLIISKIGFLVVYLDFILYLVYNLLFKLSACNIALVFFICVRPFYLLSRIYALRVDNFWYVFIPIMLYCLYKEYKESYTFIVLFLCTTLCMLCHQAFILTYAPLFCVLLLLLKYYKAFIGYCCSILIEFFIIVFTPKYDFGVLHNTVFEKIYSTNLPLLLDNYILTDKVEGALYVVYNSSVTGLWKNNSLQYEYLYSHFPTLCWLVALSFISLLFSLLVIYNWQYDKRKKVFFISILVIPFIVLLLFTIDCDRWFLMLLTELNIIAVWLLYKEKVQIKFRNNWYFLYALNLIANSCVFYIKDF